MTRRYLTVVWQVDWSECETLPMDVSRIYFISFFVLLSMNHIVRSLNVVREASAAGGSSNELFYQEHHEAVRFEKSAHPVLESS